MRNRIIAIVLIIALVPCLLAVPALAEDNYSYNVLDYSLPNGGNSAAFYLTGSGSDIVSFDLPYKDSYYYIDFVIRTNAYFSSIVCVNEGVNVSLNFQIIDNTAGTLYRVYGNLTGYDFDQILLQFNYSGGTIVYFLDFDISNYKLKNYEIPFALAGSTSGGTTIYAHRSGSNVVNSHFNVSSMEIDNYWDVYLEPINHEEWKKYDYIDLDLVLMTGAVDSISCFINGTSVPFDVNYINDSSIQSGFIHVSLRVYLDNIDRTISDYPLIVMSGQCYLGINSFGILSCTGFVVPAEPSPLRYWFQKVGDWFSSQIAAISTWGQNIVNSITTWGQNIYNAIVGDLSSSGNSTINNALQTQEEINQQINVQVGSAVDDWDGNISVVQAGFKTGFQGAIPALVWLSNIADSVFTGMGWFGYIFFFVGFLSVFFLIMSKSGLGGRLSSFIRRGDD